MSGSKGGGGSQTVTNRLDPAVADMVKKTYSVAQGVAGLPYQPYYGMDQTYTFGAQATPVAQTMPAAQVPISWKKVPIYTGNGTGTSISGYKMEPVYGPAPSAPSATPAASSTYTLDPRKAAEARVAGFSPDTLTAQQRARDFALSSFGSSNMTDAAAAARSAMGYAPTMVSAPDRSSIRDVSGGVAADGISTYMNPYEQQVVDATMNDMGRALQIAQSNNAAGAVAAKAFGGSRYGLVEAETNRAFIDEVGRTAAGLRLQGFNTALGAAQSDADRALAAASSNQGADTFSAQQVLQAALANQGAGLQGSALNIQGAATLAGLTDAQRAQAMQDIGLLDTVGAQTQAQDQKLKDAAYLSFLEAQGYPKEQLAILQSVLGAPMGSTSTTTQSGGNPVAGAIGGGLAGYALLNGTTFGGPAGAAAGALLGLLS